MRNEAHDHPVYDVIGDNAVRCQAALVDLDDIADVDDLPVDVDAVDEIEAKVATCLINLPLCIGALV